MNNIINIELKENEAYQNTTNGSYSVNINENVVLEEGDELFIKKCFIDTVTNDSQLIFLPEQVSVTMKFAVYMPNYLATGGSDPTNDRSEYPDQNLFTVNGKQYLYCDQITKTGDFEQLFSIDVGPDNNPNYKLPFGNNQHLTFTMTLIDGSLYTLHYTAPVSIYPTDLIGISVNKIIIPGSFKNITSPEIMKKARLSSIILPNQTTVTDPKVYQPIIFEHSFIIDSGNYEPVEFAVLLSKKCQEVAQTPFTDGTGKDIPTPFTRVIPKSSLSPPNLKQFVSTDGDYQGFDYQVSTNLLNSGASLVSFGYNNNKFSIENAHTPLYYQSSSSVPAVPTISAYAVEIGKTPQADMFYWVSQGSGVIFEQLSPPTFWADTLGFNINTICEPIGSRLDVDTFIPLYSFSQGNNCVSQLLIQDDLVIKNNNFAFFQSLVGTFNVSEQTTAIVAQYPHFESLKDKNGYYKIRVGNKILNKLITPNGNDNNIQSIISTYYSLNSYTLGTDGDAIIYTHNGQPLPISNFDIDILNANGEPAQKLGGDSTVFIQINKKNLTI